MSTYRLDLNQGPVREWRVGTMTEREALMLARRIASICERYAAGSISYEAAERLVLAAGESVKGGA